MHSAPSSGSAVKARAGKHPLFSWRRSPFVLVGLAVALVFVFRFNSSAPVAESDGEHAHGDFLPPIAVSGGAIEPTAAGPEVHPGAEAAEIGRLAQQGGRPQEAAEAERQAVLKSRIEGEVVTADGRPVPGAAVGVSHAGVDVTETDAQGRFTLAGVGSEPVSLYAVAPGLSPTLRRAVKPGARVRLVVQAPGSVRGIVKGAPAPPSFRVDVCDPERREADGDEPLCIARRLYDPAAPSFEVERLPPGRYEVVVVAEGFVPARRGVEVAAGSAVELGTVELAVRAETAPR
jgi:hypothetical protein